MWLQPAESDLNESDEDINFLFLIHIIKSKISVHCGYLILLFLGLWAELAAGRAILKDPEVQSIADDLQVALMDFSSILKETSFPRDLLASPCPHVMDLNQGSQLLHRLAQYQTCAERLVSLSPDVDALCRVVTLNHDLLQHLGGSHQDSAVCPSSSSSSPSDFDSVRQSLRCVQCWSQQVAALCR